jgi:RNA polymerase sigma-70 factor (ECF subfamily)
MTWFTRHHTWLRRLRQHIRQTPPPGQAAWRPHVGFANGVRPLTGHAHCDAASAGYVDLPDDVLLQWIAVGNQQAFRTLYDRHSRLVFSLARYITGDRRHAEDVTQDVFVLVWQCPVLCHVCAGTARDWLAAITRNRAVTAVRQGHSTTWRRAAAQAREDLVARDAPDLCEQQRVLRDTFRQALGALPPDQRELLERAYYGGCTATELASDVGVPVDTVKSRMRLALGTLRMTLRQAANTYETNGDQTGAAERAVGE